MSTRVTPTKALLLALLGAGVLHFLARTTADPWLAVASGALVALPVASLAFRPSLQSLEIRHTGPRRVVAGELFDVVVVVRNTGDRETPPVQWRHEHPALSPIGLALPGLAPGEQVELPAQRQALRRGVLAPVPGRLTTTAPFGLLSWSRLHLPQDVALIVHPVTRAGRVLDAAAATTTDRSVPVPGTGLEVLDLRPWRPGDARREVSARASARHGKPVVLQRERDAGPSLVVLAAGGGHGPQWEAAVSAVASAAVAAVQGGHLPVVLADPPPGRMDATGLLDFFAGADAVGPLRAGDVRTAVQRAGRGGTVLVLAPRGADAGLAAAAAAGGCRLEVHGGQ